MATVLFVKANDRPVEQAVSVKLYYAFLENYRKANPNDEIIELDLYAEEIPYMDSDMINGIFKSARGLELTEREASQLAIANHYIEQFLAADKVVFGFPLWNFTVPAILHTYIDYLNQAGKTFRYTPQGPVGLAGGKKVALLNARGGDYSSEAAKAAEMSLRLVELNMRQFGIDDITSVVVEGHNQYPDRSAEIIQAGVEEAAEAGASF
ncbi:FMN-dependent NADH-azoreductase [Paenibacillus sp. GCM10027626]|uniref:FMN-dependent NADH-azoreductase n=1 Tax=Paenibacillus sp. GCM10027626 TaxID=3273411 RepID=UPI00362B2BC3